ncbi:MAG: aldehyde dehydrogenase family protein [Thermoflexales bacterium]|nr:aldehyde dehydrogenase family protein [Thermoflexales bacterium]MDW8350870.1 aldehyde dehydrogenase family protein [Anaerolineae bacterium]
MTTRHAVIAAIFQKLGLREVNYGACGNGCWINDRDGGELISYDPTTGAPLARVIQATTASYDVVVRQAQNAFMDWRLRPAPKRGELIRDLGSALRALKEPLGDLITLEVGKIRVEGHGEVQEMIDICDFAVGLSRQLYGLTMHSERPAHRMYEQWHPLGPVGVITAFNFPVAVWSWNAAIAVVCGDTVVWKPSPLAPLCAIAVQHICNRVAADHHALGVFNLVIGPNETVGEAMLDDARLPLISFTGSTAVGRHAAARIARRLGRSILELGGNNAIIVAEDADLDLAVRAIVFGAIGTAGQRCTTTRRLIVHKSIAPELIHRLQAAYAQAARRLGDPLAADTLVGPLITPQAVQRYCDALQEALAQGGEILAGGRARPDVGPNFVEPTLIKMPWQTAVVRRETFAPILYLVEYESLEHAIYLNNEVAQGLSSAIFTDSLRTAERFLSAAGSDCGIANVNIGTSGAEIGGAFGGEKDTGGGREAGSDAWKAYMRRQTNTINYSRELPLAQGIRFEA